MNNNPLKDIAKDVAKDIADIYNEQVKQVDQAGLAEVFKRATEKVFNDLREELANYCKLTINIEDVTYLDGYFIFGKGTNSVVHFHIKETPGWKYGIWYSPIEESGSTPENPKYKTDRISCSIFTQYEEEIDKFKPSASMVAEEFEVSLDNQSTCDVWKFAQDIKFIHDEPYLAFYREMHYSDFNREYVSRAKAKGYFKKHFEEKKSRIELTAINDQDLLDAIYSMLKDEIDEGSCFIQDRGSNWSPRYEVIFKNLWDIEDGYYNLFDLFEESDDMKKLWSDTLKECEGRAKKADFTWYSCCSSGVLLLSEDNFNSVFSSSDKVVFNSTDEV